MKKFLITIIFFALPVIIGIAIVEVLMQNIPTSYSYKRHILESQSSEAQVLILGSSHTACQINPDFLSLPSINAANLSQRFNYDYFVFDRYFDRMTKLKYVIIPISYFSFNGNINDYFNTNRDIYYARFMGCSYPLTPSYYVFSWEMRSTLKKIKVHFLDKAYNVEFGSNSNGFIPADAERKIQAGDRWNDGPRFVSGATLENDQFLDKHIGGNLFLLEKIADRCAERGIQLVFITTPATDSHIDALKVEHWQKIQDSVKLIVEEYSNVSYHDFMRDTVMTLDDFVDPDHLSVSGARKFTLQIDSLLVR